MRLLIIVLMRWCGFLYEGVSLHYLGSNLVGYFSSELPGKVENGGETHRGFLMQALWRTAAVRPLAICAVGADVWQHCCEVRGLGMEVFLLQRSFTSLQCSLAQGKQEVTRSPLKTLCAQAQSYHGIPPARQMRARRNAEDAKPSSPRASEASQGKRSEISSANKQTCLYKSISWDTTSNTSSSYQHCMRYHFTFSPV